MNIAVVNFSGNVGKTTIVRHLLAPNLPDHTIVAVETLNIDRNAKVCCVNENGSFLGCTDQADRVF